MVGRPPWAAILSSSPPMAPRPPAGGARFACGAWQKHVGPAGWQPQSACPDLGIEPLAAIRRTQLVVVHHLAATGPDGGQDWIGGGHGGSDRKKDMGGWGQHGQ